MDRIPTPAVESATGETAEVYERLKESIGSIPNAFAAIGAHGPAALKVVLDAESVLASSGLDKADLETIKLVASMSSGCLYCVAAHTELGKMAGLDEATLRRLHNGERTGSTKRDALANLVRGLTMTTGTISDVIFAMVKAVGYTDAQLVYISLAVALTSFTNVFNRINDTALDIAVSV